MLCAAAVMCAACPAPSSVTLDASRDATVRIDSAPLRVVVDDRSGHHLVDLRGLSLATDFYYEETQILPGWDGYRESLEKSHTVTSGTIVDSDAAHATVQFAGDVTGTLNVRVEGARVRLSVALKPLRANVTQQTSMQFALAADEGFFGLGERFASLNHRGQSLYAWAEEGGLPTGEDPAVAVGGPNPNGPSMTYFPVPFMISSAGWAMHMDTTLRTHLHLGDEHDDAWRLAVGGSAFDVVVYAGTPLETLDMYTADTGRPMLPAPWVFGPRRRVSPGQQVGGVDEWRLLRDRHVPTTGLDDAVHFLPHLSQAGHEAELSAWTHQLHAAGYKIMAYNNPYVSKSESSAAEDFAYGKAHGLFLLNFQNDIGETFFISGRPQTIATIDLTNPEAVAWFQSLLKRTLDLGYDGWMHDFGEYVVRDWHAHDGSTGESLHNRFPVLSAKAAFDVLERERPGDYLFFVRSGYAGSQAYVPAVWGGDAEADFDDTQGLPSAVRSGLNLGMSGVPYWGSDGTGFKCLTNAVRDKEVYLRWAQLMAVSPIMMEQNACSNPLDQGRTKWTLWSDDETTVTYAALARLHTRLLPYFLVLAEQAHRSGIPLMRQPFLLHPDIARARLVDDAYYLGPSLYVAPVVRRGETVKHTWLPPGRFVDLDDGHVYQSDGTTEVDIPAPLSKLPLLLVSDQLLPLLDSTIETLGETDDIRVVTPSKVQGVLDVMVALSADGHARMTLADGTALDVQMTGAPDTTLAAAQDIAACARCQVTDTFGDVVRVKANSALAADDTVVVGGVSLRASGGPMRRVRWTLLRLP